MLNNALMVRILFFISPFFTVFGAFAQSQLVTKLQLTESVPAELLASRSIALFDPSFNKKELEEIQKLFTQTGIDTEAYIEEDVVMAGRDVTSAYANYFLSREIKFLVILDKTANGYRMVITAFNNKATLIEPNQTAWVVTNANLHEMLMTALRNSWISQKKQNLLINEFPETGVSIKFLTGNRSNFFAIDLKVDLLAVPFFNEASSDTLLLQTIKENYPFKFKFSQSTWTDEELIKKGYHYILCSIHTRGSAAKQLLGYDMTKAESAYVSTTYQDGQPTLKTISAEEPIYKFYVRHLRSGNVFFGTKWDADTTWEQALKNHIKGFKAELKIE